MQPRETRAVSALAAVLKIEPSCPLSHSKYPLIIFIATNVTRISDVAMRHRVARAQFDCISSRCLSVRCKTIYGSPASLARRCRIDRRGPANQEHSAQLDELRADGKRREPLSPKLAWLNRCPIPGDAQAATPKPRAWRRSGRLSPSQSEKRPSPSRPFQDVDVRGLATQ